MPADFRQELAQDVVMVILEPEQLGEAVHEEACQVTRWQPLGALTDSSE